ncbi:MAG TPA: hypothetical protein VIZ28_19395 [Chitinophagaceae bacterium]
MRKALFSFILLATGFACYSQISAEDLKKLRKKRINNYVITGSLVMMAGAADGANQALLFQYPGFKKAFPHSSDQFWKPSISGANKYKNGDPAQGAAYPGSRTWLVFTTDGYHLTRFTEHLFMSGAIAFKISGFEKRKWYIYAAEIAGYWLMNRVGFCMTYNSFKCYP